MRRFYRIKSTIPLAPPSMTIGHESGGTAEVAPNPGYTVKFSELFKTKKHAKEEKARLQNIRDFGTHRLEQIECEPGTRVTVEGKLVTVGGWPVGGRWTTGRK